MPVSRTYGGVTAEDRRDRRRAALIDAALDLLGSDAHDLSVRAVCASAKLTQRYFYESFASLDEIQVEVFTQIADEVARQGAAAVRGRSSSNVYDACRTAFEGAYSVFQSDPRKARATLIVSANADGVVGVRRAVVLAYAEAMRAYLGPSVGGGVASPRGRVALLYAVGGALEVTQAVLYGEVDLTHDELCDEVGRLLASSILPLIGLPADVDQ